MARGLRTPMCPRRAPPAPSEHTPTPGGESVRTTRTFVALAGVLALLACPSVAAAQTTPPPDSEFQKVVIDDSPGEPMDLAVMPDGRVLHVTRQGHVWLHDPDTGLK